MSTAFPGINYILRSSSLIPSKFAGKYQDMDVLHEPNNGVPMSSWTRECWERSTLLSMCCPILRTKSKAVLRIETTMHPYPLRFSSRTVACKVNPSHNGAFFKASYPNDADKTLEYFTEAIQFYPKRVAGVKYLGNFIIRILSTNKKPALVSIENYHDWRNELKRHLDGP